MKEWQVVAFPAHDPDAREAAAHLLVEEFRAFWPDAWATLDDAVREVDEALAAEKVAFAAVRSGELLGWIGGQPMYGGNVWELHPLVVRSDVQGRGIGRALVERLTREVAARGALTLWVGTDDEANLTSLGGEDLYPGLVDHLRTITARPQHPFGFYRRMGFEVAGVVPDANGFGKPDILMAKRVASERPGRHA